MKKNLLGLLGLLAIMGSCSKNSIQQKASQEETLKGTAVIDGGTLYQAIDGIGFSSAWCGQLSTAKNNALYGTLGMSLLRVRIDQNSANWADETANSAAAHAAGVKVLGSEWSPPVAWTSNGQSTGGYLLPQYYANYASYLNQAATNIGLDFVSFQNEPDISGAVLWTPAQILTFVKNNSATIGKPIVMPESFHFDDAYSDPVLNDADAVNKVTYVGGHIYGSGLNVHQNAINKGKHVWMTEYYINGQTDITACMTIAKNISDCMNNQMSTYFWWWVNDNDTNVNLVTNSGTIFKNGYTIGQFAKWVRPGKVRIAATYNPSSGVYLTAYRNGGIVLVAVNTSTSAVSQSFTLQNITGLSSFNVTQTSSSQNMANLASVAVTGNAFTYTLPAQSVTTFHQY
ncbi:glycoside hydrolase [Mucilaginibacter paludis]|uniref:Glucuronoarabinoxylan EndO-1,4-beta-xylanase n=1 Tax=Mucilaginibacter paludis DSM 18603 TaxID=714943 RepID=H1YFT8_9SPHI|nr:glycoside hydrolase family 30 beta sandwich domain-containing protein [Mucilaginibacter paludis]EHQ25329.1 glucuronoarabinoxylan EndO-1,4-beta-xylanase [Mucilaginibacter paludis DSM 18603]